MACRSTVPRSRWRSGGILAQIAHVRGRQDPAAELATVTLAECHARSLDEPGEDLCGTLGRRRVEITS